MAQARISASGPGGGGELEELGPGIVPKAESPEDDSEGESSAENSAEAAPADDDAAWSSKGALGGRSRE